MPNTRSLFFGLILILFISVPRVQAQEESNDWDNILYYSNKVGWGSDTWRHTVLLQARYNNGFTTLEQWFVEYAATYLIAKNFEITPDFRFTQKPDRREYRPALGVIYKNLFSKSQLVHQLKWQYDFKDGVNNSHALRYAIFYNHIFSEHIIASLITGGIYEWGEDFTGFWGLRSGFAVGYLFNKQHAVSVGWLYGLVNTKEEPTRWANVGIPTVSLTINIRKDYKYLPAKYINF